MFSFKLILYCYVVMRVEDKEVIYLYCDVVDDCGALIG